MGATRQFSTKLERYIEGELMKGLLKGRKWVLYPGGVSECGRKRVHKTKGTMDVNIFRNLYLDRVLKLDFCGHRRGCPAFIWPPEGAVRVNRLLLWEASQQASFGVALLLHYLV